MEPKIVNLVLKQTTAKATYDKICVLFEGNRYKEISHGEHKYAQVTFKSYYDPIRFLTEFKQLYEEIAELGANFDPEYLGGRYFWIRRP